MIKVENLTKSYRGKTVLNKVSMTIEREGEICGLIGLNGAGKSTLMKIICGLTYPDSGKVEFDGEILSDKNFRSSNIGFMIEAPAFFNALSGRQNLTILADLYPNLKKEDVFVALERVGLVEHADKKYKAYSLGMKQRLHLAYAIINKPKLLILDEPFNGIDPVSVMMFKLQIKKLSEDGTTVLISSHSIADISSICDSAIILNEGKVAGIYPDVKKVELDKEFFKIVNLSGIVS